MMGDQLGDRPAIVLGERATSALCRGAQEHETIGKYVNSVIYRDGWSFVAENTHIAALNQCCTDPLDRRIHIRITRTRNVSYPTTIAHVNDLILELICEIEDHERLEWLRQYQPQQLIPQPLFEAHRDDEPFNGPAGFNEGKRVYEAHTLRMKRALR